MHGKHRMNALIQLRQAYECGDIQKQDYVEAAHAQHAHLFEYLAFLSDTDVESVNIQTDGIFVRSRSQQIELYLDPEDQHLVPYTLMNFRAYEMAETDFLKSIIHASSVVLDIGANCGWYSLALARHCPTAHIHAFEPIPHTHGILARNIQHNGLTNVVAHRLAFSNHESTLEFLHTPRCSGATSLLKAGQPVPLDRLEKITCPSTTLDKFCAQHGLAPDIIKCDVEGAELMVIQGGEKMLAAHKPVILIELLRKWSRQFGYHPNDVVKQLAQHGYQAYTLGINGLRDCPSIDEDTIETNFIFLHPQKDSHIA